MIYRILLKPPAVDSLYSSRAAHNGGDKWPVYIKEYTIGYTDSDLVKSWFVDRNKISNDIYRDFLNKNSSSYFIKDMELNQKYCHMLSSDSLKTITDNFWDQFYSNYPKAYGIITLSRVGFNKQHNRAFLRIDLDIRYGSGEKIYCFFDKVNSNWILSKVDKEIWTSD
ncbi:MAG: hypothetical protein HF314_16965 [Ignavibacteria bacterium]|jgi:hypothetical protein|nr:hypothetical protein [Ignavibacteria bacterium]MCU7504777.1 hypothetical protein [Ignavibacteria bacterium]MCU7518354.1 hypothetical protein [Ignavibacteria bacterium]